MRMMPATIMMITWFLCRGFEAGLPGRCRRTAQCRRIRANGNEQGVHAVSTATVGHRHVRRELTLIEFSGGQPDSFRTG